MSDPELEAKHGQTPKQRLEGMIFGLLVMTIAVIVITVVMIVV